MKDSTNISISHCVTEVCYTKIDTISSQTDGHYYPLPELQFRCDCLQYLALFLGRKTRESARQEFSYVLCQQTSFGL